MKKFILFFCLLFLVTGCDNNEKYIYKEITINDDIIDNYIDDNPIIVGLYQGSVKINNYSAILGNMKDIGVFNVYFTDKEVLDSSYVKYNFKKYYNEYKDIDGYKVGFYISFYVGEEMHEQLILDPSSKHIMGPYLYVYLYDDVNQVDGTFYSHLELDDMKDNTIISSIKLFLAQNGTDITSPITLEAFTYNNDDFTKNNYYRGKSNYTINIDMIKP